MKDFFMSSYACKEYLYWNKFQASVSYFATWADINKKKLLTQFNDLLTYI